MKSLHVFGRSELSEKLIAVKSWSKDKHLTRMQDSGCFRYMKELVVHHMEKGNAERFIGLTLSYGIARYLKQGYLTEQ